MTGIVKGVAIIFMMILHCYGNEAYDVALDFSHAPLSKVHDVFKVCVGMFTFMVGYGYAFSKNKDWRYSLQHIKKLLIPFWTILFVFTIPICWKRFWGSGYYIILLNLFGVDSTFNWYSWFVYFFIYAMVVMPFIARFINRTPLRNAVITIILSYIFEVAVHSIPGVLENKLLLAIFNCLMMTPGMVVGYLFAHGHYYERYKIGLKSKSLVVLMSSLTIVLMLILRYFGHAFFGFNYDFVYAAVIIGAIVAIFNTIRANWLRKPLQIFGKFSVYMWFFHALFYTEPVRWFYQPAITIFGDANLVVLWCIILTFVASWLIIMLVEIIKRIINSYENYICKSSW